MTEETKQQDRSKKFYWLKLKEGFFRDKRIKKLRRIAGGDTYTIIYLKMQLLSLRENGLLIYENVEESLAEELALELDENEENVKVTLAFLFSNGLLEELDGERYLLPEAVKNIGKEGSSAERMRRHRAKKREKLPKPSNNNKLEAPKENEASQSDEAVTTSDTEKREKKEEKRENIKELTDKQRERVDFLRDLFDSWSVSDNQIFYISSLLYKQMDFKITDSELSRDLALYDELNKLIMKAKAENVKNIYRWLEVVIPNWRI